MKQFMRNLMAVVIVAVCLSCVSSVLAQNQNAAQPTKGEIGQVKDKRRIFVDIFNKSVKQQVEEYFSEDNRFEIVQNQGDAEIIFSANLDVDNKPSFGTVENNNRLPVLQSSSSDSLQQRQNRNEVTKRESEFWRTTRAFVTYNDPSGNKVIVWKDKSKRITKLNSSGGNLEIYKKSGDELALAKLFVKELKKSK